MYRVILVEDEPWALMGLQVLLERISDQFQIVQATTNPLEALHEIQRLKPDMVFTDIRMPGLNGIELMQSIRQKGMDTPFVVISGFSEFAYAQQAMKMGVWDYLLKPLDETRDAKSIHKLLERLEQKSELEDAHLYAQLHAESSELKLLLQKRYPKALKRYWQVVVVEHARGRQRLPAAPEHAQCLQLPLGPQRSVVLINTSDGAGVRAEETELFAYCGLSTVADDLSKLPQLLREAEQATFDHFIYPDQTIHFYTTPQQDKVGSLYLTLYSLLKEQRMEHAKAFLQTLTEKFRRHGLSVTDALTLWNLIADTLIKELPNAFRPVEDLKPINVYALIARFGSMENMCRFLCDALTDSSEVTDGSVAGHFNQLLAYANEHFMEEINQQQLCDRFYINVSYCCELFQRKLGMTFTRYIASLRMERACEMLRTTDLTVRSICKQVGYNDYYYFDKVFKKKLGCTPSEYRKHYE